MNEEGKSNTPDFKISDYLYACLEAYEKIRNDDVVLYDIRTCNE